MSAREIEHMAFENINGTFTILGQCEKNAACKQAAHGTGDYYVGTATESWTEDNYYSSYYTVTHIHPPIPIMSLPKGSPKQLNDAILRASRVIFTDPGLAATALRATVEVFLTTVTIPAKGPNGNFRTADQRIKEWGNANPTAPSLKTCSPQLNGWGTPERTKFQL